MLLCYLATIQHPNYQTHETLHTLVISINNGNVTGSSAGAVITPQARL